MNATSANHRGWALVTGGARRLGAAIVRELSAAGYSVAIHYHDSENAARELVDELVDGDAVAYQSDLRSVQDCMALSEMVWAEHGSLTLLVNNAGMIEPSTATADPDAFDRAMNLNLRAPYLLSTELGQRMKAQGGGNIVNIASGGALRPYIRHVPYSLSKAGLLMLTRTLSRALAPAVRVNAIAPGAIELDNVSDESSLGPMSRIPLGRYGTGRDIARGVLFLAGASYVSGQCLAIDGGASMGFDFTTPS